MSSINHNLNSSFLYCTILLFISVSTVFASSYENTIYNAFTKRDMRSWEQTIKAIEVSKTANTVDEKMDLINYHYGLIAYLIGKKQYDKAEVYIYKGRELINEVLHESPSNVTAIAFKGSFLGFEGAISTFKTIILGVESKNFINKALKLDPNNIQALIDRGGIYYYAPGILGGSKTEALKYYQKAARIIEINNDTNNNWVYLNLLTMIAGTYKQLNRLHEAKAIYEKALKIEPNIIWVKNDLYPKLLIEINKR